MAVGPPTPLRPTGDEAFLSPPPTPLREAGVRGEDEPLMLLTKTYRSVGTCGGGGGGGEAVLFLATLLALVGLSPLLLVHPSERGSFRLGLLIYIYILFLFVRLRV